MRFFRQVESMVLRDRNHPSMILWSLCNEEGKQGSEEGGRAGETMKNLILKLDKTRLITCAMNGGYGEGLSKVVDLQGFNYNSNLYDSFHTISRNCRFSGAKPPARFPPAGSTRTTTSAAT